MFKVIIASLALLGLAVSAASLPPKSEYYNDIVVDACLRYMDSSSGGRHQIVEVRNYKSNHQFYVSFTGDFLVTQYKPDSKPVVSVSSHFYLISILIDY